MNKKIKLCALCALFLGQVYSVEFASQAGYTVLDFASSFGRGSGTASSRQSQSKSAPQSPGRSVTPTYDRDGKIEAIKAQRTSQQQQLTVADWLRQIKESQNARQLGTWILEFDQAYSKIVGDKTIDQNYSYIQLLFITVALDEKIPQDTILANAIPANQGKLKTLIEKYNTNKASYYVSSLYDLIIAALQDPDNNIVYGRLYRAIRAKLGDGNQELKATLQGYDKTAEQWKWI